MPVWLRAAAIALVVGLTILAGAIVLTGCAWRYDDSASSGLLVSGEAAGPNPCQPVAPR
jgi:hypothetical protein